MASKPAPHEVSARQRASNRTSIARDLLVFAMVVAALGPGSGSHLLSAQRGIKPVSLGSLFESYRAGEFGAVEAVLRQPDAPFAGFVTQAEAFSGAHRSDPAAAGFLLEVAQAAYVHATPHAFDLFEDGCTIARQGPPGTDFDRAWQLAALSLMEGRGPAPDFASAPPYTGLVNYGVSEAMKHFAHLSGRGLDPGILALAKGIIAEQYARNGILVVRTVQMSDSAPAPQSAGPGGVDRHIVGVEHKINISEELRAIENAIKGLDGAAALPNVKAEATLRRGGLQAFRAENGEALGLGWADEVLDDLSGVEKMTTDNRLVYLSRLLRAQYLQARGRLDAAETVYRSAAELIPEAQSARLGLAAVRYLQGAAPPTPETLAALTGRAGYDSDPWASFRYGDYRLWPERLQELRTQVQREMKK